MATVSKTETTSPALACPKSSFASNKFVTRLVTVGLIAVGLGVFWHKVVSDYFVAKRFGVVVPNEIYRSGQISQHMIGKTLEKHKIDVIVDLTPLEGNNPDQQAELEAAKELEVEHYRFPLVGNGTGDLDYYTDALVMIDQCVKQDQTVLVHCAAGAQRTGSIVAAYRVLVRKEDPKDAYAELGKYGWNEKKDQILLTFLNDNMQQIAEMLVEKKVLETVPDPLPKVGP